jgi:predicted small secreted protein
MKRVLSFVFLAVTMAVLAGCATVAGTGAAQNAAGSQLQKITGPDLDAAIAEATAGNDPQGVLCFTAVKTFLAAGGTTTELKGVFSDFEAARLLRRRIQMSTPEREAMHNACAPLVVDANVTLAKLGLIAGGL